MQRCAILLALLTVVPANADTLPKPVVGPKLICLKYSSFDLADGEAITDLVGGMEGVSLTVRTGNRTYHVGEGEIFAEPLNRGDLVDTYGVTSAYRTRSGGKVSYALYGPTSWSEGKPRKLIVLDGSALSGEKQDATIYKRFRAGDPEKLNCGYGFRYGWEDLLPTDTQPK